MNIKSKLAFALLGTLLLAACGSGGGISGTYMSPDHAATYTFANDKLTITSTANPDRKKHYSYSVDGNKITIQTPMGSLPATLNTDGSLTVMGGTFTRVN